MISDYSPADPKAFKRNAALWSLVGAHNSAAASAAEATRLETLAKRPKSDAILAAKELVAHPEVKTAALPYTREGAGVRRRP
ncbi:MAG: hypothetical protein AAB268_01285 [Elusimicrobiota bacterium]